MKYVLECCVDSVESAIAAEKGGANRLELCANLIIGGTTPSLALYEEVRKHTSIRIHALLRPRFVDLPNAALLERVCDESLYEAAALSLACTPEQAKQAVDDFVAHADTVIEARDIAPTCPASSTRSCLPPR